SAHRAYMQPPALRIARALAVDLNSVGAARRCAQRIGQPIDPKFTAPALICHHCTDDLEGVPVDGR
ncbi:MAG: hypothetical protein ACREUQ_07620, partial [Burkholderiales bacterium]